MSSQEVVSPVTADGFALQLTQQIAPALNVLHSQRVTQALESDILTTSDVGAAAAVVISRAAQFYSELQLLQSQNPDQYKQVLTGIVDTLNAATGQATGAEQQLLSHLSEAFQQAANGDLSALLPSLPDSVDLSAHPSSSTSTLGNLVAPQEQKALNLDLPALQAQETSDSTLFSVPTQETVSLNTLLAPPQEATLGDLFVPPPPTGIDMHGVVAVYGPHNQLLTEAFPSQDTIAYLPPLSANTQQALNSIFNDLHSALTSPAQT